MVFRSPSDRDKYDPVTSLLENARMSQLRCTHLSLTRTDVLHLRNIVCKIDSLVTLTDCDWGDRKNTGKVRELLLHTTETEVNFVKNREELDHAGFTVLYNFGNPLNAS